MAAKLFKLTASICLHALLATLVACSSSEVVDSALESDTRPEPIIDSEAGSSFFLRGQHNGSPIGTIALVNVAHKEFSQANRVSVTNPSGEFWKAQLQFPVTKALAAGDVVLVHLYFRSVENTYETGKGFTQVFLEDNTSYEKYLSRRISAGGEWQEFFLPAKVTKDQSLGNLGLKIGFGAGDRPQVFDVAGVELLNYGEYDISLLPVTRPSYYGREPNAAWRRGAAERIEQYRKGDFRLRVLDAKGQPLAKAKLDIDFKKHAYHFGSVTVGQILAGSDTNSRVYKEKVLELFNQSGPENDLKWGHWVGDRGEDYNQAQTLAGLQWLRARGLYTRGHVMVWPSKRHLPELIQQYLPKDAPEKANPHAKQLVLEHIDELATATANYLNEWDVVNEPYDNHYLMDAFGDEVMVDWFKRARKNLPRHKLYLNDYSILSGGGHNLVHQQHFKQTTQFLLDNEAPITGLGLQSHFAESPTSIPLVYSILDQLHSAFPQLDIRATEFDIRTADESLQADYTRDFLTIFFSHPATVGVQLWGFWAGAHHAPEAALYDINWQEKPNARAWKTLIYKQWWNDFEGQSDASGAFRARGFYGDYRVTIDALGRSKHVEFTVAAGQENDFVFLFDERVEGDASL